MFVCLFLNPSANFPLNSSKEILWRPWYFQTAAKNVADHSESSRDSGGTLWSILSNLPESRKAKPRIKPVDPDEDNAKTKAKTQANFQEVSQMRANNTANSTSPSNQARTSMGGVRSPRDDRPSTTSTPKRGSPCPPEPEPVSKRASPLYEPSPLHANRPATQRSPFGSRRELLQKSDSWLPKRDSFLLTKEEEKKFGLGQTSLSLSKDGGKKAGLGQTRSKSRKFHKLNASVPSGGLSTWLQSSENQAKDTSDGMLKRSQLDT